MNDRDHLEATLAGLPEADVERILNPPRDRFELLPIVAGIPAAVLLELTVMSA